MYLGFSEDIWVEDEKWEVVIYIYMIFIVMKLKEIIKGVSLDRKEKLFKGWFGMSYGFGLGRWGEFS